MAIAGSLIILLLAAIAVIAVSVFAYNRRLDRIVRGEARDTHSPIPEPKDTVSGTYRIVLMVVAVFSLISISAANGRISSLQNSVSSLESQQHNLSWEISQLREELRQQETRINGVSWEVKNADLDTCTADVRLEVSLREFTEDTEVSFSMDGNEVKLAGGAAGTFRGDIRANLFEAFRDVTVCISEGGVTRTEPVYDFPDYFFWDYLPTPGLTCSFNSDTSFGRMTCEGAFSFQFDRREDIESVTLTYMTGGKDLETLDITKEAVSGTEITLPKGLKLEKDLTFRTEIETKSGFRMVKQDFMVFEASPENRTGEEFFRIYGKDGELVWEDPAYSDYKEAAAWAGDPEAGWSD